MTSFLMRSCKIDKYGVLDLGRMATAERYNARVTRNRVEMGTRRYMIEITLEPDRKGRYTNRRGRIDIGRLLPGQAEPRAMATGDSRDRIVIELTQLEGSEILNEAKYVIGRDPDKPRALAERPPAKPWWKS
jgi:hypothetical protein